MDELLDPVAAYDRLAPEYGRIAEARRPYLDQVERVIASEIPLGKRSLLDVGAGDGQRSARIASACGIERLVLLEPSEQMGRSVVCNAERWTIRAQELSAIDDEFDVIVCLWNVLGHIDTANARGAVMEHFGRLLAPGGLVFIDVNHRYNARHYGLLPTAGRYFADHLWPREANGDVVARWNVGGDGCATRGHVFTDAEIRKLARAAGLAVRARHIIDYASGQLRSRSVQGHLLYRMESTSE